MSEINGVPEFESDAEYIAWAFNQISEGMKNLGNRIANLEIALSRLPEPGPNMIQYKIPEDDKYSNLKEVLDDLYVKLNSRKSDDA